MIVLVESNFVLELALQQEDVAHAEAIVALEAALVVGQKYRLSAHDAIVFASVEHHLLSLGCRPVVFVTKDHKDFDKTEIHARLKELDCKLVTTFFAARRFLENAVRTEIN